MRIYDGWRSTVTWANRREFWCWNDRRDCFVLDLERVFVDSYNHELIDIHRLTHEDMEPHLSYLHELIDEYVEETGSRWGQTVSEEFQELVGRFWLIKPKASDIKDLMETLREAA